MKKILLVVGIVLVLGLATVATWFFWPRSSGEELVAAGKIEQFVTHDFIGLESVA